MEYITTKEASAKWGISTTRITVLANEGRIPGAQRLGKSWLIPAGATKPEIRRANHSRSAEKQKNNTAEKTNEFSFPLYHFRPDWNLAMEAQLSKPQKTLLLAETALLECRFFDAYTLLESILLAPDDISTEIGTLGLAGICCVALNKPDDFSRIFLRLQMLLSADFPHRDDLVIILDFLKTYMDTLDSTASNDVFNTDIHHQCLPLLCLLIGYSHLTKEVIKHGTADIPLLELGLRFLKSSNTIISMEIMHCYLLGIYFLRNDMVTAEKHAKAAVQMIYENKFYYPLATYYHYFSSILDPILAQYPEDFQAHCQKLISQYTENFSAFLTSITEHAVYSKLTDADYPYIYAVLTGIPNASIAEKLGVHPQTVKNRLARLFKKMGVSNKKELRDYLRNHM